MANAKPSMKFVPVEPEEPKETDGPRQGEKGEFLPATYTTRRGNVRTDN